MHSEILKELESDLEHLIKKRDAVDEEIRKIQIAIEVTKEYDFLLSQRPRRKRKTTRVSNPQFND